MSNAPQKLVRTLWKLVSWLRELLEDDAMRTTILNEIGLNGSLGSAPSVDPADIASVEAYLLSDDPDVLAFISVADSVARVFNTLETLLTPIIEGSGSSLGAKDALYLLLEFSAIDLMRRDAPGVYATARATGLVVDHVATHELPDLDTQILATLADLAAGEGGGFTDWLKAFFGPMETEEDARLSGDKLFLVALGVWYFLRFLEKKGLLPELEYKVLAGWDPPPGPPELADSLSQRAVTWSALAPVDSPVGAGLVSTWIAIPAEHGGPGVFISLGGQLAVEVDTPGHKFKANVTAPEALNLFIATGSGTAVSASATTTADWEYVRTSAVGGPALAWPRAIGSRVEARGFGLGFAAETDRAIAKLILDRCALVLSSEDPDSFLAAVFPADGVRADFDLSIGFDFIGQRVVFGGSAKLEIVLPIARSLGPLTILYATIALVLGEEAGAERGLAVRLSLSLKLLALTAVADGIGYRVYVPFPERGGRLGLVDDPQFGFLPPKGVGLRVNGKGVSGGGFLFFDPDNDEYAGVLALEFSGYSLKVVGLIRTNLGASPDFSLLLIGSVEGLTWALPAGGLITGIGIVLGMHRTMAVEALQAGIKNRTLDAILFPKDPIANAPQIVAALKTVFPPAADQWIVGVSLQAAWINKKIVRLELAILVEFPSPTRIALLGQGSLTLPTDDHGLVQVNFDVIGILDLDHKFLSVDSVLYSSRIGTFPLTGGMAVRANWGDHPGGAGAFGGLHPRFPLPDGFPKLERLAVTIGKGGNPRIRGSVYIGATSNTFQFGVRAELYAGAGGFSLEGDISLDLLFQFDPFRFMADLSFKAAVKYRGHTLAGLHISGSLEGPGPWRAEGKVRIKILFIKVTKHFGPKTWGDETNEIAQPVEVWAALESALASPESWRTPLPSSAGACASLRAPLPGDFVDVNPLGALEVVQRVAPLGIEMDKFRNAPIAGERRFDITGATVNGIGVDPEPVREHFAPGQHLDLGGDAVLSRPSFELFTAGARLGPAAAVHGAGVKTDLVYEEIVLNESMTRPGSFGLYHIPADAMLAAAEFGAVALHGRTPGGRYAGPRREVSRVEPGFVAASVAALAPESTPGLGSPDGASYTEVLQSIRRREAFDPSARDRIQVVRAHEVQAA